MNRRSVAERAFGAALLFAVSGGVSCSTPAAPSSEMTEAQAETPAARLEEPKAAPPAGWKVIQLVEPRGIRPGYSIALPPTFQGGPRQGIDSELAEFTDAGLKLVMEYDRAGSSLACGAVPCVLGSETFDGRRGRTATFNGDFPGRTSEYTLREDIYVEFARDGAPAGTQPASGLRVSAYCQDRSACDIAKRIVSTLDFQ